MIFSIIKAFLQAKFTEFIIDKNTIESRYSFLTNVHKSFTIDKITSVTFSESIVDKIFKTCSITFSSIWSGSRLVFKNISKNNEIYQDILRKTWYEKTKNFSKLSIDFSLKNWFLNNIYSFLFSIVFFIIMIFWSFYEKYILFFPIFVLFYLIFSYFYCKLYYSSKYYNFWIFQNFFEVSEWIIFQSKKYCFKNNIKSISSVKIPFSTTWNLFMEISWDIVSTWEKWQESFFINILNWNYVKNIFEIHDLFDSVINNESLTEEIILEWKPSFLNQIFSIIIFSIIFWWIIFAFLSYQIILAILFWILWILIILLIYINIKFIYYKLEKYRIIRSSWIIYKRKKSVVLEKINFVEKSQWFIWKIFWNWIVKVHTVWGSFVDLMISDTENYLEFYDKLKK